MLAVLARNPDNGIIDYGGCNVLHKNESAVVLEYLDFYKQTATGSQTLRDMLKTIYNIYYSAACLKL
jgi:hypothetical protein